MKKTLITVGLLALAVAASAEQNKVGWFNVRYDLDSTSMIYCIVPGGTVNSPFDHQGKPGYATVTAAASTTLESAVALAGAFTGVSAGDLLLIEQPPGTVYPRTVLAVASVNSITIDEAITVTAAKYTFYTPVCGTGASSGWIHIGNLSDATVSVMFKQINTTTGVDVRIEGAMGVPDGANLNITQLWPTDKTVAGAATTQTFTTAGITSNIMVSIPEALDYVRVGLDLTSTDDGTDTTTAAEQISVVVFGRQSNN